MLHSSILTIFVGELPKSALFPCFQAITSKGGHFLEAPVSGSKKPAEDGQLVILAAGEKVDLLFFDASALV